MIRVTDNIVISEGDIVYRFTRSSGPGGQNVNKLNTRVILLFNVVRCRGLTGEQKQRVFSLLQSRISDEGLLKVVSQRHRTQKANRQAAQHRLVELLAAALKDVPIRKQSGVPFGEKLNRLRRKRRRSELKQLRKPVALD